MFVKHTLTIFAVFCLVNSLPQDFKESVSCYGNTHDQLIKPACTYGSIIAVRDMWATSKLKSTGCPEMILSTTSFNQSCCQISEGDCKLEFDKTKRGPYLKCSGVIECSVGTDWQQMVHTCGSLYLENSNIQSLDYNCIMSAMIMKFNIDASQKNIAETYISNEGFPFAMTSSSGGTCYITSCSTGIVVGLIDLRLSENSGTCGQKLTISDGSTTTEFSCDRNNDLQWTKIYESVTSAIYISFVVTSAVPDAFIWIDVSGYNIDAYCGKTESFTPQSGAVCTTTAPTTTTITTSTNKEPKDTTKVMTTEPGTSTQSSPTSLKTTSETVPTNVDSAATQNDLSVAALAVAVLALIAGLVGTVIGVILCCQLKKSSQVAPASASAPAPAPAPAPAGDTQTSNTGANKSTLPLIQNKASLVNTPPSDTQNGTVACLQ